MAVGDTLNTGGTIGQAYCGLHLGGCSSFFGQSSFFGLSSFVGLSSFLRLSSILGSSSFFGMSLFLSSAYGVSPGPTSQNSFFLSFFLSLCILFSRVPIG